MTGRFGGRPGRLVSVCIAACAAIAVLSLAASAFAQVELDDDMLVIDLGGKVYKENCNPCHANIAQTDNYSSEIIFQHGYHQLIACNACHSRFPHRREGTEKPIMTTCFYCHGLQHGPMGELATGKCEKCHNTPENRLRPAFHTPDWAGEPHVQPSLESLQTQCMMCHDGASCDECHDQEFVRWEPDVPYAFDSDGGCMACHGDENLTKTTAGAPKSYQVVGVDQSAHRDLSCQQCHIDYEYEGALAPTPIWQVNAGYACAACHSADGTFEDADRAAANKALVDEYNKSAHAVAIRDGNLESATCAGCHGGHYIQKLDTELAQRQMHGSAYRTCARCHKAEYESYDDYYHGAAYKRGNLDSPACWDCHGAHYVLPSSDPESLMSADNRIETCGSGASGELGCHYGSGESFTNAAGNLIHQKGEVAEGNALRRIWSSLTSWMN